jgi:capsular exopolysaccharide synthesis family protein
MVTGERARSGPQTTVDLLELVWRRRRRIIACLLLGIGAAAIYCMLAPPVYESVADVLVVQKRPQAMTGDRQYESGFEDYIATHLAIISSPLIVERAIKASDLSALESFSGLEVPDDVDRDDVVVDAIIDNLAVEGGSRELGESANSIMTLAFRSIVPEDCPVVLQALLDSYETFHHEVYHGMTDSTVSLISQARDLLKNDIARQEESYNAFRQTSPLVAKGNDEINPLQDRLTTIELQRSALLLQRTEIKWQLLALEQARKEGRDDQQMLEMVTELRQHSTAESPLPTVSTTLENQLIQMVDDEQKLLEHFGPNHPHVQTLRQRIADTRRLFVLPTAVHFPDLESVDGEVATQETADPVAMYTDYLEQELKRLQISEDELTALYEAEHDAAKEHSIFQLKDESYRRGIERTEALYDVVVSRLQEASLIKDFGGFETRVIAYPRIGTKVGPSLRIFLPAGALAGLLLGFGWAFLVELRDDRFQSSEEIPQRLGATVVGQIPQFAAAPNARRGEQRTCHPMLCSWYQPRSAPAESFRSLRTALYMNLSSASSTVIQVSGTQAGDGASTVAANLAVSLAQTGKRILLIDADLKEQRQQQLFGIAAPESGLAALITSDVEPEDVVCQTAVDNLWLLPAGRIPDGPLELFTSKRFGELIQLFRDRFDHVLIDTEPMLAASDPVVIASRTDGVVLTLNINRNSRQRARQAKAILDRVAVTILGVVINRSRQAQRFRTSKTRNLQHAMAEGATRDAQAPLTIHASE